MAKLSENSGYTLIELVLVLVIIGILAGVGMRSLTAVTETSRIEETRTELRLLAEAIRGNPALVSGGARTDFGYVGDIGALPPNLDALVSNPGGYSTWDGPYTSDEFGYGGGDSEFKIDAWGSSYTLAGGVELRSTGGSTALTQSLSNSLDDLLHNRITLVVTDLDHTPPGTIGRDSVRFVLTYPNGAGGLTNNSRTPYADGRAVFDSIPIGNHLVRLIYLPSNDTLRSRIVVPPGNSVYTELSLANDYWSGS